MRKACAGNWSDEHFLGRAGVFSDNTLDEKDGDQREPDPEQEMIVGIEQEPIPIECGVGREGAFQKTIDGRDFLQQKSI